MPLTNSELFDMAPPQVGDVLHHNDDPDLEVIVEVIEARKETQPVMGCDRCYPNLPNRPCYDLRVRYLRLPADWVNPLETDYWHVAPGTFTIITRNGG